MTEQQRSSEHDRPLEVTHDITPFDSLTKFIEEREHTESEIVTAIEVAIKSVYLMPEDEWDTAIGEITGIALEYGVDPEVVLELYAHLEPKLD